VNGSKENNAPLILSRCNGGANQSWVLRQGLDLTWEERVDRNGHHRTEFNLPAADPNCAREAALTTANARRGAFAGTTSIGIDQTNLV
jgi:hypothetical protein